MLWLRHPAAGELEMRLVFGKAVFQASPLVPANRLDFHGLDEANRLNPTW